MAQGKENPPTPSLPGTELHSPTTWQKLNPSHNQKKELGHEFPTMSS